MEEKKLKIRPTEIIMFIIIFVLAGICIFMYLDYKNRNESNSIISNIEINQNDETTNETNDEEPKNNYISMTDIETVLDLDNYIKTIYPLAAETPKQFPVFDEIEKADLEWIWTTALRETFGSRLGEGVEYNEEINTNAHKLYGKNVGTFLNSYLNAKIDKLDSTTYAWLRANASITTSSNYIIKSIEKSEDNIYLVEIAEYLLKNWNNVAIVDSNYNTLFEIFNNEQVENMQFNELEINKKIDEYITQNLDNLETKLLKIEYNEELNEYHIISSTKK